MADVRKRIGWATALAGMVLLCWSAQARAEIGLTTDPTGRLLDDGSYLVDSNTVITLTATEPAGTPDVIYHIAVALYGEDLNVPPIGKAAWRTASFKNVKKAALTFKLDTLQDNTPIRDGIYHITYKYSVYAGRDGHAEGRGSKYVRVRLANAPRTPSPNAFRPSGLSAGVAYNLVENAGFEKAAPDRPGLPAGFIAKPAGRGTPENVKFSWETPGHNSNKAIAIDALDVYLGYWETTVPVKPRTEYVISFHYKCRSVTPAKYEGEGAAFRRGRPCGPNLELGVVPHDESAMGKPTGWSDIGISLGPTGGTYLPPATEWAYYRQMVTTDVVQTRMRLKLRMFCSIQKVWFDDLSVIEPAKLPKIELLSLSPAAVTAGKAIRLRWKGPEEADTYFVEYSMSPLYVADVTARFKVKAAHLDIRRKLNKGLWFWRVGVPDQHGLPAWVAESTFRVGARTWAERDTTPPTVCLPKPLPNAGVEGGVSISARFHDTGAGVDVASAVILLDGRNVTAQAKVTPDGFTLKPARDLANGAHRVVVRVSDNAGNRSNLLSWRFGVGKSLRYVVRLKGRRIYLDGEPYFPIGIWNYRCHPGDGRFSEAHLAAASAAGIDCILNTIPPRLDMLQKYGMKSLLNITSDLRRMKPGSTDVALAKATLARTGDPNKGQAQFNDHPCVLGYWADDPENLENTEGTPTPPNTIIALNTARKAMKELAPDKPLVWAISNLPRIKDCIASADIMLAYRYPVPQYHPQVVNSFTLAYVYSVLPPDKPIMFNSQALDLSSADPQYNSREGMRPTVAEMRAMAYYSMVMDISGYTFYANYLNEKETPEHWRTVLKMATEFRYLAPALAAGKPSRTASLQEDSTFGSIYFREIEHEGVRTIIAVNMSGASVTGTWNFESPTRVSVLFEDRATAAKARRMKDVFKPFEVHVYRWQ